MIPEFIEAAKSLQALTVLLKAAKGLTQYNEMVSAVTEINIKLMAANDVAFKAQDDRSLLSKRIAELEEKIMGLGNWDRDSERYQLQAIAPGVNVFCVKPGMDEGEPPHYLCTKCYNERKKSYLQRFGHSYEGISYRCDTCKSEIIDHSKPLDEPTCDSGMGEFFS